MIGYEHDQRVLVLTRGPELAQEAAELAIAEGDVAVVLADHALAVERLLVVRAGVLRRVLGGREGLEHPVEGRGRRVGHVRVHGVHVQEGRQAPPGAQEAERGVDDDVGAHELAAPVVARVQAGEGLEAGVEGRLGAVDDRVGDRRAGREAALREPARDRGVRRVERVAQLHRAVLRRQARGEDRGHRGLRPRGVHDRPRRRRPRPWRRRRARASCCGSSRRRRCGRRAACRRGRRSRAAPCRPSAVIAGAPQNARTGSPLCS